MTSNLTLDHAFAFRLSTILHWTGVALLATAVMWMAMVHPHDSPAAPCLVGIVGVVCFVGGFLLAWAHVSARCLKAERENYELLARKHMVDLNAPSIRLHLLPNEKNHLHVHRTWCWCNPVEETPGVVRHRFSEDLNDDVKWSVEKEEFYPNKQ